MSSTTSGFFLPVLLTFWALAGVPEPTGKLSKDAHNKFSRWVREACGYETGNRWKIDLVYLQTGRKRYIYSCCSGTQRADLKISTRYIIVCYDSDLLSNKYGKPRRTLCQVLKYMRPFDFPYFSTTVEDKPIFKTAGDCDCCCDCLGPSLKSTEYCKDVRDWSHMYNHESEFSKLHDFTELCDSYAKLYAHPPTLRTL